MIVFIAGMPRSGSTFTFNVVRDLLQRRGTVYQKPSASVMPIVAQSGDANHIVFKEHQADDITLRLVQLGAIRAVCTVRRPEDAIASWSETFGFSVRESIAQMQKWLAMFARLRDHALIVHYEQIDLRPRDAAFEVARYICPDARWEETVESAGRFSKEEVKVAADVFRKGDPDIQDAGFSYFNTKNFFHRHHVSTLVSRPAAERIGVDAVALIRQALKAHIDSNGDLLPEASVASPVPNRYTGGRTLPRKWSMKAWRS